MVIQSGSDVGLGVTPREVTVLFSDIESFTTICEKIPPSLILKVLSRYFAVASDIIGSSGGTLLEFIGDGLLVSWNAPNTVKQHCSKAVSACLAMQSAIATLSASDEFWVDALQQVGKTQLRVRMGLHAGTALCGNLGSTTRLKYGMLGDVVNVASRLEELNKRYQTNIIVSEAVVSAEKVKESFVTRVIDRVAVKGKEKGLTLYEVLAPVTGAAEFLLTLQELHDSAFMLYLNGSFAEAAKALLRAEEVSIAAKVSGAAASILLNQALFLAKNPPPTVDGKLVFDGTTHLTSKDGS
jgi:adenylate cyclase